MMFGKESKTVPAIFSIQYKKKCAMEVKTIGYVFFSFLFLACNNGNKAKEVCENSLDSTLDDKVLLEDAYMCDSNKNSIISEKELRTYNKFQTFNEFKMRGEGKICNNLFVYVKEKEDTIIVRVSNDKNRTIQYIKKNGVWHNYQEFDMQKKGMPIQKDSREKPARSYYRIFKKDTIMELACTYPEYPTQDLYIKTKNNCVIIPLSNQELVKITSHPIEKIMEIVSNYKNGKYETRTLIDKPYKYTKYENNNFYYYVYTISNTRGVEHADTLTIPKTSLLEFGIGPGLYENLGVSSDYFSRE